MATTSAQSIFGRLARLVGQGGEHELLPLEEAEKRLRPFQRHYAGLRPIPIEQVVGTDSRGSDFDREFRSRRRDVDRRLRRVEEAFPEGDFPPIVVFQIGDAYFVIDGHHRVAAARHRGMEMIDAEVTELVARWHLHADADIVELIHAEQQRIFMEESGLDRTRPSACIDFSRPAGYIELLENVQIHGYHLMIEAGRALAPDAIAADWYERVYSPAVEAIHREGLDEDHPQATDGDLFLWVYQRRRGLFPDSGCPPLERLPAGPRDGRKRLGRLLGRLTS